MKKITKEEVEHLRAKALKGIAIAESSEKKAVVALRVLRNTDEAKKGLERALNIF
tara:strand:+ start:1308 stop:1472 length:165 start_codon:yes stop_codon:yes gene_type:complete